MPQLAGLFNNSQKKQVEAQQRQQLAAQSRQQAELDQGAATGATKRGSRMLTYLQGRSLGGDGQSTIG